MQARAQWRHVCFGWPPAFLLLLLLLLPRTTIIIIIAASSTVADWTAFISLERRRDGWIDIFGGVRILPQFFRLLQSTARDKEEEILRLLDKILISPSLPPSPLDWPYYWIKLSGCISIGEPPSSSPQESERRTKHGRQAGWLTGWYGLRHFYALSHVCRSSCSIQNLRINCDSNWKGNVIARFVWV